MPLGPAYAKINLALEVTGRRPDGYHELRTVFLTVDWHDLVGVELAACGAGGDRVRVEGTGPTAAPEMAGTQALVAQAGTRLLELAAPDGPALRITVHKRVAAGAGLGGGSADAAAVLRLGATALRRHGASIATPSLFQLAARLRSAVSAQLAGRASLGPGRGALLAPLPPRQPPPPLAIARVG